MLWGVGSIRENYIHANNYKSVDKGKSCTNVFARFLTAMSDVFSFIILLVISFLIHCLLKVLEWSVQREILKGFMQRWNGDTNNIQEWSQRPREKKRKVKKLRMSAYGQELMINEYSRPKRIPVWTILMLQPNGLLAVQTWEPSSAHPVCIHTLTLSLSFQW